MTALAYSSFKQDDIVVFDPPEFDFRVKSGGFDRERVADGQNWYVYCSNNPLSMVDPTGLNENEVQSVVVRTEQFSLKKDRVLEKINQLMVATDSRTDLSASDVAGIMSGISPEPISGLFAGFVGSKNQSEVNSNNKNVYHLLNDVYLKMDDNSTFDISLEYIGYQGNNEFVQQYDQSYYDLNITGSINGENVPLIKSEDIINSFDQNNGDITVKSPGGFFDEHYDNRKDAPALDGTYED